MQLIRSGPGLGWVDECRVTGRTRQLPLWTSVHDFPWTDVQSEL